MPIFFNGTAPAVLCTGNALPVLLGEAEITLPFNGVLNVPGVPVGLAKLTLKLEAPGLEIDAGDGRPGVGMGLTDADADGEGVCEGIRTSCEDVMPLSTVKGAPHDNEDC